MNNHLSKGAFIVDLFSFLTVVFFALHMEWTAKDLLWSLWSSSLLIGYFTLLAGFAGNILKGRIPDESFTENSAKGKKPQTPGPALAVFFLIPVTAIFGFLKITLVFALFAAISIFAAVLKHQKKSENPDPENVLLNLIINFPAGIFILLFFTIHFGGFHFVHSIFLNGFFPLSGTQPFGMTPGQTFGLFGEFITTCIRDYWLFIGASAASSFESIIGAAGGGRKDFMLEPYKNVIKMHLMIFVMAFAGMGGLHDYILYAVLLLYFFPVGKIIKDLKKTSEIKYNQ
ncbi:MAG: hypothetical protein C4522_03005 [Desulfobacteraceae bacterium]|nr:MAG: hypothetical protein C4522_03005 [Desulfobacteraceae bacterium]